MKVQPFIFRSLLDSTPIAVKAQPGLELVDSAPLMPEEPPVKTYSEEEVAKACDEAYQRGLKAGEMAAQAQLNEEAQQREEAVQQVLRQVDDRFAEWATHYNAFLQSRLPDLARLTTIVAQKIVANALKEQPLAPLEAMLAECMSSMSDAPKMTIAVHPSLVEALEHRISPMARQNNYGGVCSVIADPDMHLSDARIEWKNGFAERKVDELWQHLETMVQQVIGGLFAPLVTLDVKPAALTNPSQDETNS